MEKSFFLFFLAVAAGGMSFGAEVRSGFTSLPPGAVKPTGWLRDWCVTAKDGYIGHLDEIDEHFRIAWTTNCTCLRISMFPEDVR